MALPINIDDLVNSRTVESVRIEFKRGWNPEEVLHTMCAYANDIKEYGSGYIVIGIDEGNGTPILPPNGIQANQLDKIQKEFVQLCFTIQPNIFPTIEPVELMGQHIVVIWVTSGEERPYTAPSRLGAKGQRRIYVRPASVTIPATAELEKTLRELAKYRHFDDLVNTKASINDLDLGLIQAYLQEVKSNLYTETLNLSMAEIATKMQIARGTKENLKPLNVGLLMFNKNPEQFFEGCITNLVEFEDDAGTQYSEKKFQGPVHLQIRQIIEYIKNNVIKEFINKDNSKAESNKFANYPYQALEEAIVNALYHRSYENPRPNEIRIYKRSSKNKGSTIENDGRRIEILSYPGPLPPIDENALAELKISARNYRNLKLGDWLKNLKLAEKYATGLPTILNALDLNGSPRPILSTDAERSHFLILFYIHPDVPIELTDKIKEFKAIALSDSQQQILEKLIDEPMTDTELNAIFDRDTSADIEYLLEKELLKRKSTNEEAINFITPAGRVSLKNSF